MSDWLRSKNVAPQRGPGVRSIIEDLKIPESSEPPKPEPVARKVETASVKAPEKMSFKHEVMSRILSSLDRRSVRKAASEEEDAKLDRGIVAKSRRVVLICVAILASVSCAAASVYFSNKALVESQPPIIAMIMALTIVATLTVSPELSVSLKKRKKYITSLVVSAIALVATVFSMSQTVQGIYSSTTARIEEGHKRVQETSTRESEDRAAVAQVALLQDRKARLEKSLAADESTRDEYQRQISERIASGEEPNSKAVALLVANRNSAQYRINKATSDISSLEEELMGLLPKSVVGEAAIDREDSERDDFFSWVGGILHIDPETIEFALAVFPAIFIDIIAPAMLVVAFSL